MKKLLSIAIAMLLASGGIQAATYKGVTMSDTAAVGGKTLMLNGMGLREYFIFDVYVGGLYLPEKVSTSQAVLAESGPYQVTLQLLHDVTRKQFARAWLGDFKANNPGDYQAIETDAVKFTSLFGAAKKGQQIVIDYVPGSGVTVRYDGVVKGTIGGRAFAKALLRVYVGPHPPTDALKAGMLGAHG